MYSENVDKQQRDPQVSPLGQYVIDNVEFY